MALTDGLQAYWELEEASGTRADSVGALDLTDNNTVTSGTGKVGTCALFTCANSERLSVADAAAIDIDDGWSVQYWINIASGQVGGAGDYQYVYAKRVGETGVQDFIQNDAGTWYLYVGTGTTAFGGTKVNVALSVDTWYHVVIYYNGASSKVYINGSSNSVSLNGITTNAATLLVGGSTSTDAWAGSIDEFGIWNRELTQTDVDNLYNSGSGLAYPLTVGASGPANLKSYNTNVKANIKSINTNPIANIKSLNTNV